MFIWKCLHNCPMASLFRRRSVDFIATAAWLPGILRNKSNCSAETLEYRRQFYMFRKVNGNPQEGLMATGPCPQGARSD